MRNPFFAAPAPDAPSSFAGSAQDVCAGVVIALMIALALVVL